MFDHATKIREITEHAGALKEGHFAVDGLGGEIHAEKFFAPSTITENPNLLQELASEFTKLLLVEQPYLRECTTVLTANSNHAMLFGSYVAHALALKPLPTPATESSWSILPKPGRSHGWFAHSQKNHAGPR